MSYSCVRRESACVGAWERAGAETGVRAGRRRGWGGKFTRKGEGGGGGRILLCSEKEKEEASSSAIQAKREDFEAGEGLGNDRCVFAEGVRGRQEAAPASLRALA